MENDEPPQPEKLFRSLALTAPLAIFFGFVVTSIFSTTLRLSFLPGLAATWLHAVFDCIAVYKRHRFPPKVARRRGLLAGTMVALASAVLAVSSIGVGCRK